MSDPVYVRVRSLPGLRFRRSETDAGEGFVWLRPAFIAMRVRKDEVEPWADDPGAAGSAIPGRENP